MEKSLEELLSDAFSESSVPSLPEDEELDFESLDFKGDGTILSHSNNSSSTVEQEDISPLLETASTSLFPTEQEDLEAKNNSQESYSSSEEESEENEAEIDQIQGDFTCKSHNIGLNQNQDGSVLGQKNIEDKEDFSPILETPSSDPFRDDQERFWAKNTQDVEVSVSPEDCTSPEEESEDEDGKIELKAGDFETICCSNDNEQVFAMGPDVDKKDENQNSKQEEEKSYSESIKGNENVDTSKDEDEDDTESTKIMFFQAEYTLKYPKISFDEIEKLTDEEDHMEEFSGDEHQEAGESFAEYPSDFSSCEYVQDTRNPDQESDFESQLDEDLEETSQKGVEEEETEDNKPMIECIGENNTQGDSEMSLLEMANQNVLKLLEDEENDVFQRWTEDAFSTWSNYKDGTQSSNNTNVTCNPESEYGDQCKLRVDYENVMRSMGEEKEVMTTVSSNRGSVDDSFFFRDDPKVSDGTDYGQMEDDDEDEEEEKRREQERIQAFYRFYDDEDGDSVREERQIKVQFCVETLSQVIHYETDSTERESESSCSDEGDKDLDLDMEHTFEVETCPSLAPDDADLSLSEEHQEDQDHSQKELPDPPEITNPESTNKPVCNRNHKCLSVLKLILSLFLAVVMGLLMFWWWVTYAEEWPAFIL